MKISRSGFRCYFSKQLPTQLGTYGSWTNGWSCFLLLFKFPTTQKLLFRVVIRQKVAAICSSDFCLFNAEISLFLMEVFWSRKLLLFFLHKIDARIFWRVENRWINKLAVSSASAVIIVLYCVFLKPRLLHGFNEISAVRLTTRKSRPWLECWRLDLHTNKIQLDSRFQCIFCRFCRYVSSVAFFWCFLLGSRTGQRVWCKYLLPYEELNSSHHIF